MRGKRRKKKEKEDEEEEMAQAQATHLLSRATLRIKISKFMLLENCLGATFYIQISGFHPQIF